MDISQIENNPSSAVRWTDLPDERLLSIFGRLYRKELYTVLQTCRYWLAVASDETLKPNGLLTQLKEGYISTSSRHSLFALLPRGSLTTYRKINNDRGLWKASRYTAFNMHDPLVWVGAGPLSDSKTAAAITTEGVFIRWSFLVTPEPHKSPPPIQTFIHQTRRIKPPIVQRVASQPLAPIREMFICGILQEASRTAYQSTER